MSKSPLSVQSRVLALILSSACIALSVIGFHAIRIADDFVLLGSVLRVTSALAGVSLVPLLWRSNEIGTVRICAVALALPCIWVLGASIYYLWIFVHWQNSVLIMALSVLCGALVIWLTILVNRATLGENAKTLLRFCILLCGFTFAVYYVPHVIQGIPLFPEEYRVKASDRYLYMMVDGAGRVILHGNMDPVEQTVGIFDGRELRQYESDLPEVCNVVGAVGPRLWWRCLVPKDGGWDSYLLPTYADEAHRAILHEQEQALELDSSTVDNANRNPASPRMARVQSMSPDGRHFVVGNATIIDVHTGEILFSPEEGAKEELHFLGWAHDDSRAYFVCLEEEELVALDVSERRLHTVADLMPQLSDMMKQALVVGICPYIEHMLIWDREMLRIYFIEDNEILNMPVQTPIAQHGNIRVQWVYRDVIIYVGADRSIWSYNISTKELTLLTDPFLGVVDMEYCFRADELFYITHNSDSSNIHMCTLEQQ